MDRGKLLRILLSGILLIAAAAIEHWLRPAMWQLLLIYLVPYLIVGYRVIGEAIEGIAHGEAFDENFLMLIATIGALSIGFMPGAEPQFTEAVFVMLFFQVGELFEDYAEGKSRRSIAHLVELRPDTVNILRDGSEERVASGDVAIGNIMIVRPGERIALDGEITDGEASLDTSALTGESKPRTAAVGDVVMSGCINMSGVIKVRVSKTLGESTVSRIIALVESAGERKSRSETFISRFAKVYTPIVVMLALIIAILPSLFSASAFSACFTTWFGRALTFLVVSCPCALVISVPLTFFAGIGGASKRGILIKGSTFMDILAKVRTIVFDKTGTLTMGIVATADRVKSDSRQAIERLRAMGVGNIVMLTGDHEEEAARVAREVGLDEWHSGLLPAGKVERLEQVMSRAPKGSTTAFVGDGINDAPVLARADVGIAMGALGTDAAIEAADVVIMDDKPSNVAEAISISRRTIGIAMQNVVFAIGVKVLVLLLAAIGMATMWMAVFADVGVCVIAVCNAMRALTNGRRLQDRCCK